ncbi:TspO/MBR-related protein [Aulographum hederae CBS 113979]|uniref:TspO/MBR-related protein n=1 Tax=Aulographum hederae CBS 113979 TaxID=1176131 RepID=A0A6G1H918_9PEZI|nr:TspO/MBR-related protein [Aulographum hederae CBS 113979]
MTTYVPSLTLPSAIFEQPAASILLPLLIGPTIGYAVRPDRTKTTYRALKQPPGNPPPQVFGPVWTALYATMGYAAYRAYAAGATSIDPRKVALAKQGATLYTIQLGLNLIWMPLFFGLGRPIEATADIIALTGVTGYLAYIWVQVDEISAWCLAPYLGWLGFATYLSAGCGYLNKWNFKGQFQSEKDK